MKTAYKINWGELSIQKVPVFDDWTEDYQHEHYDYLVWATFENAREELVKGLKAEIEELEKHTEEGYFSYAKLL